MKAIARKYWANKMYNQVVTNPEFMEKLLRYLEDKSKRCKGECRIIGK